MIDLLKTACAENSIKPELRCINITSMDGNIQKVTATDAFRLHQINGLRTGFEPGMYNLNELQKQDGNYPDTSALKHPEYIYFEGSMQDLISKIETLKTEKIGKTETIYIETENYTTCFSKEYIEDAVYFIHEMSHIVSNNIKVLYDRESKQKPIKISVGDNESGAFALIMSMNIQYDHFYFNAFTSFWTGWHPLMYIRN